LNVRPESELPLDLDEQCVFDKDQEIKDVFESPDLIEVHGDLEEYKKNLKDAFEHSNSYLKEDNINTKQKKYPELTVLGTASATPGKYRNNSCYMVEVKEDHFIIMDCGEVSLSQLCRLKGEQESKRILRNLKAIYISHQHADHHLGSINLLIAREEAFQHDIEKITPLYFVASEQYRSFLTVYHKKIQSVLTNVQLLKNEELLFHNQKNRYMENIPNSKKIQLVNEDLLREFKKYTSLSHIETCRALHCRHAHCVTFKTEDGFKLTYSGDTRPIPKLVELGKGSDLLIHEASMEHCMQKDAIIKKHSTFTEAIEVGKEMEAKFTLLTHFSQRYSKTPLLEEIENEENVGIAFDNMVLRPDNYQQLRLIYPALKLMFYKEMDDMQERSHILKISQIDQIDPKDEIIKRININYEMKLEQFERINKWRKDTVDKQIGRDEILDSREARERLPKGVNSLASKIRPSVGANSSNKEALRPPMNESARGPSRTRSASPTRSANHSKSASPSRSASLPARKNDITAVHEKLLKMTSLESSGENVFKKRSPSPQSLPPSPSSAPSPPPSGQTKRSLSPPSPRTKPSLVDISDRLIKVAKK